MSTTLHWHRMTDAEKETEVAVNVARLRHQQGEPVSYGGSPTAAEGWWDGDDFIRGDPPHYLTDANPLIALLQKWPEVRVLHDSTWTVEIFDKYGELISARRGETTFHASACISLLRASGVEVVIEEPYAEPDLTSL